MKEYRLNDTVKSTFQDPDVQRFHQGNYNLDKVDSATEWDDLEVGYADVPCDVTYSMWAFGFWDQPISDIVASTATEERFTNVLSLRNMTFLHQECKDAITANVVARNVKDELEQYYAKVKDFSLQEMSLVRDALTLHSVDLIGLVSASDAIHTTHRERLRQERIAMRQAARQAKREAAAEEARQLAIQEERRRRRQWYTDNGQEIPQPLPQPMPQEYRDARPAILEAEADARALAIEQAQRLEERKRLYDLWWMNNGYTEKPAEVPQEFLDWLPGVRQALRIVERNRGLRQWLRDNGYNPNYPPLNPVQLRIDTMQARRDAAAQKLYHEWLDANGYDSQNPPAEVPQEYLDLITPEVE